VFRAVFWILVGIVICVVFDLNSFVQPIIDAVSR
jgi:hypothetical protein